MLAAGVAFATWTIKKELVQCEMKKAAKDLKSLLPLGMTPKRWMTWIDHSYSTDAETLSYSSEFLSFINFLKV